MYGYPHPTPCPGAFPYPVLRPPNAYPYLPHPVPAYSFHRASLSQRDDTSTIDYTTELQAPMRNTKPRRPKRRTETFNPATDIFEDETSKMEKTAGDAREPTDKEIYTTTQNYLRRSSVLLQRPQRIPGYAAAPGLRESAARESIIAKPRRRRVSEIIAEREENTTNIRDVKQQSRSHGEQLRKDPRRRTIYVPSEDTTIMTIHPGAPSHHSDASRAPRSPDFGLELVTVSEEEPDDLKSVLKKSRASRKSLAIPPRRKPLQQSTRSVQSVTFAEDQVGSGDGKENLPPGRRSHATVKQSSIGGRVLEKPVARPTRKSELDRPPKKENPQPMSRPVTGKKRISSEAEHASSPASKSLKAKKTSTAAVRPQSPTGTKQRTLASTVAAAHRQSIRVDHVPSKLNALPLSSCPQIQVNSKYPVISEDLAKPELYEDQWLNHQEVALTQLLNCLLQAVDSGVTAHTNTKDIRKDLLALYNDSTFTALHKRIQASLHFGALTISKDLLSRTVRLKEDVGLRRRFLNLWLETYDLFTLQAAVEAIVGRLIPSPKRASESDGTHRQQRHQKRALEEFLDVFLIRNEDAVKTQSALGTIASIARAADGHKDDFGSQTWSWRRTVLRSLMLVLLLDKAKTSHFFGGCLFQHSSSLKSSTAVLQTLGSIVLPSIGDIARPLHHMGYAVQNVQYPLEEYVYHVENLATDLRDGVVLTRIVELLLYTPASLMAMENHDVTLTLPTGEQLTSIFDPSQISQTTWVLSHHLKFPCLGRAQKVYNVQIALSALDGLNGITSKIAEQVTAEDVVDGHREKTLGLLWGLVGRCGLSNLINRAEVNKEIARLRGRRQNDHGDESSSDEGGDNSARKASSSLKKHARLLHKWAFAIGRQHGIRVPNLTTSFADGKAFEAIVDEYLPYCSSATRSPSTRSNKTIAAKLSSIGCSRAFTSLFTPSSTLAAFPIPTRDFTVSTLAFLASRLLPLVRSTRAAVEIQQAYRRRLARKEITKRLALMRLASHCAIVVQTRERVVSAAVVLQKAWRQILDRRINELVSDVVLVQSLARGWKARKDVKRGGKKERIRGGW